MEAAIKITVTTIIILSSEKPTGQLAPSVLCQNFSRLIDAVSVTSHHKRRHHRLATGELAVSRSRPGSPAPLDVSLQPRNNLSVVHPHEGAFGLALWAFTRLRRPRH
jgi:hypothetical protein